MLLENKTPLVLRAANPREQQMWIDCLTFFLHKYRTIPSNATPSEVLIHSLLTTHAAVVVADEKGFVTDFNISAERTFGYRMDEIINRQVTLLLNESDVQAHKQLMDTYQSGQRHMLGSPRPVLGKSKEGVILNLSCVMNELEVPTSKSLTFVYLFREAHQVDDFFDEQMPEENDDQMSSVCLSRSATQL